jgi:uridine phosphorylase
MSPRCSNPPRCCAKDGGNSVALTMRCPGFACSTPTATSFATSGGRSWRHCTPGWSCYHTELWTAGHAGVTFGVVGCAVGAPFAVLVAEQLAASGCELVVSITSSGQVTALAEPPYYLLIERAWRDEGTSLHYVPPGPWSTLDPELAERVVPAFAQLDEEVVAGAAWTTDAPYRETETAIGAAREAGCHVVEMEAAALYAYAHARGQDVVCLAHVTNSMATAGDNFEKGPHAGGHLIARRVRGRGAGAARGPLGGSVGC